MPAIHQLHYAQLQGSEIWEAPASPLAARSGVYQIHAIPKLHSSAHTGPYAFPLTCVGASAMVRIFRNNSSDVLHLEVWDSSVTKVLSTTEISWASRQKMIFTVDGEQGSVTIEGATLGDGTYYTTAGGGWDFTDGTFRIGSQPTVTPSTLGGFWLSLPYAHMRPAPTGIVAASDLTDALLQYDPARMFGLTAADKLSSVGELVGGGALVQATDANRPGGPLSTTANGQRVIKAAGASESLADPAATVPAYNLHMYLMLNPTTAMVGPSDPLVFKLGGVDQLVIWAQADRLYAVFKTTTETVDLGSVGPIGTGPRFVELWQDGNAVRFLVNGEYSPHSETIATENFAGADQVVVGGDSLGSEPGLEIGEIVVQGLLSDSGNSALHTATRAALLTNWQAKYGAGFYAAQVWFDPASLSNLTAYYNPSRYYTLTSSKYSDLEDAQFSNDLTQATASERFAYSAFADSGLQRRIMHASAGNESIGGSLSSTIVTGRHIHVIALLRVAGAISAGQDVIRYRGSSTDRQTVVTDLIGFAGSMHTGTGTQALGTAAPVKGQLALVELILDGTNASFLVNGDHAVGSPVADTAGVGATLDELIMGSATGEAGIGYAAHAVFTSNTGDPLSPADRTALLAEWSGYYGTPMDQGRMDFGSLSNVVSAWDFNRRATIVAGEKFSALADLVGDNDLSQSTDANRLVLAQPSELNTMPVANANGGVAFEIGRGSLATTVPSGRRLHIAAVVVINATLVAGETLLAYKASSVDQVTLTTGAGWVRATVVTATGTVDAGKILLNTSVPYLLEIVVDGTNVSFTANGFHSDLSPVADTAGLASTLDEVSMGTPAATNNEVDLGVHVIAAAAAAADPMSGADRAALVANLTAYYGADFTVSP